MYAILVFIQIIQILSGNGRDENGIVDENIHRLRLGREDFWMKILKTNFPYGLNKTSKDFTPEAPILQIFILLGDLVTEIANVIKLKQSSF